jgi:hypothetical protein
VVLLPKKNNNDIAATLGVAGFNFEIFILAQGLV